jgi:hypothetical protein
MHRSPRSEVIRGRLAVNNYMPHMYMAGPLYTAVESI